MYTVFMLGSGELVRVSETFCELDKKVSSHYIMFGESVQGFIAGLAAFQVGAKTNDLYFGPGCIIVCLLGTAKSLITP